MSEAEVWDRAAQAGVGSRHLVPLQYLSSANSTMANGNFGASTPSVPECCLSEHCLAAHELSELQRAHASQAEGGPGLGLHLECSKALVARQVLSFLVP